MKNFRANIVSHLRISSVIICILGIIASIGVLFASVILSPIHDEPWNFGTFLTMLWTIFVSYVLSVLVYGFSVLVENSETMLDK